MMKFSPSSKTPAIALIVVLSVLIGIAHQRDKRAGSPNPPAVEDPHSKTVVGIAATKHPALAVISGSVLQESKRLPGFSRPAPIPAKTSPLPPIPVPGSARPDAPLRFKPQYPLITRTEKPSSTGAPTASPAPKGKMAGAERELRLAELLKEAVEEADPRQAQRTLLTVAGYQVGNGDWDAAKQTYERLLSSPYPEVLHAAFRNLDVVHRNQAILAESDPAQREWLQLELAGVHQAYGHEKAAKGMLRSLESSATQEPVRQMAAQRLAAYVVPPPSQFQIQPTQSEQ